MYTLIGQDGKSYQSTLKGAFGGHKGLKIYGHLDCPSANRAIANGYYIKHRVFFADEAIAIDAGYRPCGNCMKDRYSLWFRGVNKFSSRNLAKLPLLLNASYLPVPPVLY